MPNVIVRGFAGLARFSGRDSRAQFWPYAGVALLLYLCVGWVASAVAMLPVFTASQLSATEFSAVVTRFLVVSLVMFLALVALLAAAVARRLHDTGRSAFWGLLPLPFAAYSATVFPRLMAQFGSGSTFDDGLFFSGLASNMLYLLAVAALVVLLALRSTPTPNRYG